MKVEMVKQLIGLNSRFAYTEIATSPAPISGISARKIVNPVIFLYPLNAALSININTKGGSENPITCMDDARAGFRKIDVAIQFEKTKRKKVQMSELIAVNRRNCLYAVFTEEKSPSAFLVAITRTSKLSRPIKEMIATS